MKRNCNRNPEQIFRLTNMLCVWLLAWMVAVATPSGAADRQLERVRRAHYIMGTVFEIEAYGEDPAQTATAVEEAFAVIRRADEIMSDYREDSELSRLNREGATGLVLLSPDLYAILRTSVHYARRTDSAFDVTVGPLVDAWRQASKRGRWLDELERGRVLSRVGYSHLSLDESQQAARFDRPGVRVDLGGIAKGWAVDQAAEILRQRGIERALISAGTSSIYALGAPPGETVWKIAIRHPLREDDLLTVVSLRDQSVSTSGSYEQTRKIAGKTVSHILDPRNGMPVGTMWSSTVIAPTATESDALSTAAFVLGLDRAEQLLRQLELPAILVGKEGRKMVVRKFATAGKTQPWTNGNDERQWRKRQ